MDKVNYSTSVHSNQPAEDEAKETFYDQLQKTLDAVPSQVLSKDAIFQGGQDSRTCRNRHQLEHTDYVIGRRLFRWLHGTDLKYIHTHPDEE